MLEFNKTNFATLADAQAYSFSEDTKKITSGKARSFFVMTTSEAVDSSNQPLGDKWSELRWIQTMMVHELYSIADGIIGVIESDSYFGMDETTSVGQANHGLVDRLVTKNFLTREQADAFIARRYSSPVTPYANKTQADWDSLDLPEPVETVVLDASGQDYVIKTGGQDFELSFVVNDGSTDNVWDLRLEVCETDQGQHDLANWYEVTNALTPVRQGRLANTKYQIPYSSKRTKLYTRVYATPRKAVDYTATIKAV